MKRVAALLLALAACGGAGGDGADGAAGSPAAAGSSSPSPTTVARPGESAPPGVASGGGITPSAQASASTVTATLAEPCVARGETQTMIVAGLKAGEVTGYSTQYSDGSNELTNKEYTSGFGSGVAGQDGRHTAVWVVPTAAPPGRAEVLVIWASGKAPIRVSFAIPAEGQVC